MMKICAVFLCLCSLICCVSRESDPEQRPLTIAYRSIISHADPIYENTIISNSIYCNIYEPLVVRDANLRIVPALATEWSNPDDRTWVFKLRNAKFHNGSIVTAADVRFSLERALQHPESQLSGSLTMLERVDVLDSHTVRVTTSRPYSILLSRLVDIWIVPQVEFSYKIGPQRFVGTGPYRVREWIPSRSVEFEADPGYWGTKATINRVRFVAVPLLGQRIKGLLNGQIEMLPLLEPSALTERSILNHSNLQVRSAPGLAVLFLGMDLSRRQTPHANTPENPFLDIRVRKAIYHAIDIRRIVMGILKGHAAVATQLVAPKVFGYNGRIRREVFDPEEAKQLLTQAGYPDGFSVRFDITNNRYRNDVEIGKYIVEDLARVGIRAELNAMDVETFVQNLKNRDTSLFMKGWVLPSTDASGVFDFVVHTPDLSRGYGAQNSGAYSNPEVDRLIEESSGIMDPAHRAEVLEQAMQTVMNDFAFLPLHVENNVSVCAAGVEIEARPDEYLYLNTIRR